MKSKFLHKANRKIDMIKHITLIIIMLMSALSCSQSFAMDMFPIIPQAQGMPGEPPPAPGEQQVTQETRRSAESCNLVLVYGRGPLRFGPIDDRGQITSEERSTIENLKRTTSVSTLANEYIRSRKPLAQAITENCNSQLKDSILVTAVICRDYYLAKHALTYNANPNTKALGSPIIFQAETLNIVTLLVDHGAVLPHAQSDIDLLLYQACDERHDDWRILRYYLTKLTSHNPTLLHQWAEYALGIGSDCEENIPSAQKKLRLLLEAGANPTRKDYRNRTALDILKSKIQNKENKSAYSGLITMLETAEKKYNEKQVSS